MQWLVGVLVLILCFMKRGEFSGQIISKLGSSFSTVAFVVVVVSLFRKLSHDSLMVFYSIHA
jgi:palmitoyltransferase ZDHHC1/11